MFLFRNSQTDNCLSECFNKYDDGYYCNANGVNYCCKTSVSESHRQCFTDASKNIRCSKDTKIPELKYAYCLTDESVCGPQNLIATLTEKTVQVNTFSYHSQRPCRYKITTTIDIASKFKYIEVTVDYYFAT